MVKKYAVTGIWTVTETRYVTAKSKKEAAQKLENGEYTQVSDNLQFRDFIGIETIERL